MEMVKSAVANNQPFAMEYRIRHTNGAWRTVWEQGRPVQHGRHPAVQGQLLDMSHRIHNEHLRLNTEMNLLQAQKLRTAVTRSHPRRRGLSRPISS